jgi:hypothetical protein
MCVEVGWGGNFNTHGLMWIHVHPNKALTVKPTYLLHYLDESISVFLILAISMA